MELEALEEANSAIKALGASLIVVSPQTEEHSKALVKIKNLSIPLLSDPGNRVAEKYGIAFAMPQDLRDLYMRFGIDLPKYNGDESWRLPMPARYIIDRDQIVRYAAVNPDYTVRPDPSHTLARLKALVSSPAD